MPKCPKCGSVVNHQTKSWKYGNFQVKMYECPCDNQFREYYHEGKVRFILSAHDGGLGPRTGRRPKVNAHAKKARI